MVIDMELRDREIYLLTASPYSHSNRNITHTTNRTCRISPTPASTTTTLTRRPKRQRPSPGGIPPRPPPIPTTTYNPTSSTHSGRRPHRKTPQRHSRRWNTSRSSRRTRSRRSRRRSSSRREPESPRRPLLLNRPPSISNRYVNGSIVRSQNCNRAAE